tara:strand:+ start:1700 stop:4852 length:3153 start_codon:yes stop_codon:yes gene_type:complete
MGSITISRNDVDACYVSSETSDTKLDTYSTFTQVGSHSSSFIADSNPSSGTAQTAVTFVQFTIPEKETTDLSSKAYVSNMTFHINVSSGGDNLHMYKVKSAYENINFANVTWYSYDQEGQAEANAKWDPSHFHGSSDTYARSLVAHLAVGSTKSPVEGEPISTAGASAGDRNLSFPVSKIKKLGYTFGSKVTVGIYADGDDNVIFSMKSTAVTITTASTKPDVLTLTSTPTSDGLSANLNVEIPNDNSLTEYYLESATSSGISATASGDYGNVNLNINNTEIVPVDSVVALAQGVKRFYRGFTENESYTNTSAIAGSEIALFRPKIDSSGAVLYSDSALSSALGSGKENVTLGQKVYLKVTNAAVAAASTGNKYTKIRVNWDSGTSDTDEDYAVYDMVDLSPVLNNGSNTVVSHIYHTAGAKVVKVQVEDENGFRSDKGNITGNQPDVKVGFPKAIMSTSSTKIAQAKYGDRTTAVTLSGQQSKTSGSDKLIESYGWGYTAALATTIVTSNALENDNSVFDDGSKRVKIGALSIADNDETVFKIFGLASFRSTGVGVIDTDSTNFDHYAYTSATASPLAYDVDARPNIGAAAQDAAGNDVFFKEIECVVCITKSSNENNEIYDCARYILVADENDTSGAGNTSINTSLFYDSNIVASRPVLGDTVNETLTATDETITRGTSTNSDTSDIIRVNSEDMFIHYETGNDILVSRGYNNTTAIAHASGSEMSEYRTANRYKWGGYAKVRGAGGNIDFTAAGVIQVAGADTLNSSTSALCWLDQGFYIGDIIKVATGASANGTYAAPKYYKIESFTRNGNVYDKINIVTNPAELSESERTYIETTMTADTDETVVEVLRYDSTKKPSISAAIFNTAGASDTVTFYMSIFDNTQTRWNAADKSATTDSYSFNYHWAETTANVLAIYPNTLDLDTLADANNIAIEKVNITRSGGITAKMPLGIRRYPVGVTRTKLGVPKVSIQVKALTQAGYRALFSLVEGNRYDYVFLDSKKLDAPTASYRTLRMKLESGNITKDTADPNVYLANLTFVIVGEDVS